MIPSAPESPVTLEKLLRLKRHEVPDNEFWDRFDRDLERRRLRALMRGGDGEVAVGWSRWRSLGWASGLLATTALVAMAVLRTDPGVATYLARLGLMGETPAVATADSATTAPSGAVATAETARYEVASLPTRRTERTGLLGEMEPRFVLDALSIPEETSHFLRIHANPVFSEVRQNGPQFVADALTTGTYPQATFLVDRPRGQF